MSYDCPDFVDDVVRSAEEAGVTCDHDTQDHEDANIAACFDAAMKAGVSVKDYVNCNGGEFKCPSCQFKKDSE